MSPARVSFALLLLAGAALAHGGTFRPPPGGRPGDTWGPTPRTGPTTAPSSKAGSLAPWESWWRYNRDPYLRVRERMFERAVVSGPERDFDPFDRSALRRDRLTPVMLEALRDEDEEVRTAAAVALGKFRAPEGVPALIRLLRLDSVKQVREAAMLGLILMRDPALAEMLRARVLDAREHRRIRAFAVLGLGFLRDVEFLSAIALGREGRPQGSNSEIEELRTCAVLGLGFCASRAALPPLLAIVADEDAPRHARGCAGSALMRLADPLALQDVMALIGDARAFDGARCGAGIATSTLVGPGEEGLLDVLGRKAQRDKHGGLRALLVTSLGQIGGERAATHIVGGMRICEPRMRGFHFLALGLSGSKDAGDILMAEFPRLNSNNDRAACALGLGLLGHEAAAPMLREELTRGNAGFVPHGMIALGLLNDREAIPLVQRILAEERDPLIRLEGATALALLRGPAAVPDLVAFLRDASSTIMRGAAAAALGMVGTELAVEPLLEIYGDKRRQGEERAIALAALGRIGDDERIPLLAQLAFGINPYAVTDAVAEVLSIL